MNESERTLKQIFHILEENIHSYMRTSETETKRLIEFRKRSTGSARHLKAVSCSEATELYHVRDQATSVIPDEKSRRSYSDVDFSSQKSVENVVKPLDPLLLEKKGSKEALTAMRENIDLKLQMNEAQKYLKRIDQHNDTDGLSNQLAKIDEILCKVLETQSRSEQLYDKLCEGLNKIQLAPQLRQLPHELKEFCDKVKKTVGQDFRTIGLELGLEPETLDNINKEYAEEEECLHQIVLEWCRRDTKPSLHVLVSACHKVNPDILNCRPLSNEKIKVLESCYILFCEQMLEVPVLPYLISSGIMSLKMQRYILQPQTRDQRITRLISVLCTRDCGFDHLCDALDSSDQSHVSIILKEKLQSSDDIFSVLCVGEQTQIDKDSKKAEEENLCANISSQHLPQQHENISLNETTSIPFSIPNASKVLRQISELLNNLKMETN